MIYVSIESRKGGVGKTTAALTLAECLIQKGYQVLLVDMDIIGTRVDDGFLASQNGSIHEVKRDGKAVNLLDLFKKEFMAGNNIPAFAPADAAGNKYLTFEIGKCNVIGSNIYEEGNGASLLEDPRVLYDAFHAYWLLELIKGISRSFVSAIGKDNDIAVILDNSPGFSSIEKVINDYLTNIGPELGKVMIVSTIDPQDIAACRQSVTAIENLFTEKMEAGRYYRALLQSQKATWRGSEGFKAVWNSLCVSDGREPEYYAKEQEHQSSFIRILVNKVPRSIYEELYTKHILHERNETAAPFLNHLLYYFSNAMLERNDIHHRTNMGGYEEFKMSGNLMTIEDDDIKYRKLRDYIKHSGLRAIFREEWAPLSPFLKLREYLRKQEVLKEKSFIQIPSIDANFKQSHSEIDNEVEIVKRFVCKNLREDENQYRKQLSSIAMHVAQTLKEFDGKGEVDFHPELQKMQQYEELVVLFGLAVYRLHIYDYSCGLINELMKFCLEDVEKMETLDAVAVDNRVSDILEGRSIDVSQGEELNEMISGHRNARELEEAIKDVIKYWGL